MKEMSTEENYSPIHSLIKDRKMAFANLVRAYLKFNVPSARKVDIVESENRDVFIAINDNVFKFDVSDYTGSEDQYIFFNPSNGRLVIESGDVKKVFKLEVNLVDN